MRDTNGLLSIVVGEGNATSGNTLADLDWGAASYEINVTTNLVTTNIAFLIYSAQTALYSLEAGFTISSNHEAKSSQINLYVAIRASLSLYLLK